MRLDYRPSAEDAPTFMNERLRYFASSNGAYLTESRAGDYFSTEAFGYDYTPGTREELIPRRGANVAALAAPPRRLTLQAAVRGNVGTVALPKIAPQARLVAAVTVPRPPDGERSFDLLVNAPEGVTQAAPGSPFLAGRIAFFGPPMHHDGEATFLVPLLHAPASGVHAGRRGSHWRYAEHRGSTVSWHQPDTVCTSNIVAGLLERDAGRGCPFCTDRSLGIGGTGGGDGQC